jgi:ADP-heptose:LPS heptosyltransferase
MGPTIRRLQIADRVLGPAACLFLQPLRWTRCGGAPARKNFPRLLLIKFWGIGSLQHLGPAVRELRRREPAAELVLLTLSSHQAFARGFGIFDRVLTLEVGSAGWTRLALRILRLISELRAEGFERVYDFEFLTRFSALVSALSGARKTFGFQSPSVWRGAFHHGGVRFDASRHVALNFARLAAAEAAEPPRSDEESLGSTPFRVSAGDVCRLEDVLKVAGVPRRAEIVVLNPNAGGLSLERRWPVQRFATLACFLLRTSTERVCVFIGDSGERAYTAGAARAARRAARANGERVFDLGGRLQAGELCALLARARLVVSNDSGPMHLAAALGSPTLGLFGPETPVTYRPIGPRVRVLWRPPACGPCIDLRDNKRSTCVHGRPVCLLNLGVEEVSAAALELLEADPERDAARPAASPAVVSVRGEFAGTRVRTSA